MARGHCTILFQHKLLSVGDAAEGAGTLRNMVGWVWPGGPRKDTRGHVGSSSIRGSEKGEKYC